MLYCFYLLSKYAWFYSKTSTPLWIISARENFQSLSSLCHCQNQIFFLFIKEILLTYVPYTFLNFLSLPFSYEFQFTFRIYRRKQEKDFRQEVPSLAQRQSNLEKRAHDSRLLKLERKFVVSANIRSIYEYFLRRRALCLLKT